MSIVATSETLGHDPELILRGVRAALDAGEFGRANELAQSLLGLAKATENTPMEAQALACLAHCDRLSFRMRRAADTSQRAVHLYQEAGDVTGEIDALNTLAHSSIMLGREIEAVEAALLGVKLAERHGSNQQVVLAYNYLGVAFTWSGNFSEADDAYVHSTEAAIRSGRQLSTYQPRLNQAWAEKIRLARDRYELGLTPDVGQLARLVEKYREKEETGTALFLAQGFHLTGLILACLVAGFMECWRGDVDAAEAELQSARKYLIRLGFTTWLDAYANWLEAEISCAGRDYSSAYALLERMTDVSSRGDHEQLAKVGYLFLHHIYERQGERHLARQALCNLRLLERRVRADSLASRARVVEWQLTARESEAHLHKLRESSRQFERWSLEDTLTGIANRRCFEQRLSTELRLTSETGQSLSIAFIDIDGFKSINDTFGHAVGDRVLKTLAVILSAHVREHDLPARLAGDEFVVMLTRIDKEPAVKICKRIVLEVRNFDWEPIAADLRVSISVGVAEAKEGDTIDSLLHRSDVSMYTDKRVGDGEPVELAVDEFKG
ncbi:diguanylate cyclase (GGDEF)-like protein [Paraburkholderia sp. Clong3]|uniref:GGDEF domain-containing protein n=1 Tax=Paraburkholderia sp. Clong3 TaxID=2991061 RepID=UPI003D1A5819